jgi:site-specific recombinase XerD
VTEPLNLRIKDVDLENGRLLMRGAKGGKDRVVALPCSLSEEIRSQFDYARAVWTRDVAAKIPLEIPGQLAKKYPEYRFAWPWAWLFPQRHPCIHPRTGELVRYRMHEANVQQGVKEARRKLGIMVLPHELRHAYATHCLDRGTNLKALQEAMGHKQIETTIGYCHAEALSVKSPLELIS